MAAVGMLMVVPALTMASRNYLSKTRSQAGTKDETLVHNETLRDSKTDERSVGTCWAFANRRNVCFLGNETDYSCQGEVRRENSHHMKVCVTHHGFWAGLTQEMKTKVL